MPRARTFGDSGIMGPVRTLVRGVDKMRPNVSFQGSYVDVHDPSIRQPVGIRRTSAA